MVAMLFGATLSIWLAIRAVRAEHQAQLSQRHETELRRQADTEKNAARVNEYIADINLAQQSIVAGNLGRAFQLLQKHQAKNGAPELRGFEWRYLWSLCQGDEHSSFPTRNSSVEALALSPEGKWLAAATREQVTIL